LRKLFVLSPSPSMPLQSILKKILMNTERR
jgi:hypothetical protein